MSKNKCPVCGMTEDEGCYCNPLECPQCGQVVSWFGEEYGMNPCEHVVAWGTVGNDDIIWENKKYEPKFQEYWSKHSYKDDKEHDDDIFDSEEEAIESFAEEEGLEYACHDDGVGHGHSTGTYVLFL